MALRKFIGRLLVLTVTGVAIAFVSAVARAQNVTFADFTQQDPTQPLFIKNGDQFTATNVPVFFRFSVDNAYDAKNVFISARLNFAATFDGPITFGMGGNVTQVLLNLNATFTADAAGANGSTNLLSVTGTNGQFNAGGQAGGLNSATDGGNTLNFSSAALNFDGAFSRNISLAFTAIMPLIDSENAVHNQNIPDFTASGIGQSASSQTPTAAVATPEPGALALLGLPCVVPVLGVLRRRHKPSGS